MEKLNKEEVRHEKIIDLIIRQTNYSKEEAEQKLKAKLQPPKKQS